MDCHCFHCNTNIYLNLGVFGILLIRALLSKLRLRLPYFDSHFYCRVGVKQGSSLSPPLLLYLCNTLEPIHTLPLVVDIYKTF